MQTLLLGVAVPLLLCFGSVVVCSDGQTTTRKTLFEAYEKIALSKHLSSDYSEFVYSYHSPSIADVEGTLVAVAEARYGSYASGYAGEIVAKYSTNQGNTWKMLVALPRKTPLKYARSINPTVVPYQKNLLLFSERFEEWTDDWTDYKNGNGDFVQCWSSNVSHGNGGYFKQSLTFTNPSSLIPNLSDEINKLQITRLIGGYGRGIEVNGTAIVPVVFFKNKERYATVLLSGSPNWKLAKGTGGPGSLESAVVEWEGKLIMNARTDDGYRKVYESTDMGNTWREALGSLSRVWGNSPKRQGHGSSASSITITIENTSVMLFSAPLNTHGKRDKLHLWLTDNKRIYDVGQISENGDNTGHSSLLYTKGKLYCVYEKERYGTTLYYSSVLAHLVDELKKIKAIVKKWKTQDNAFSESCDKKDLNPIYPGSICEVHIPQKGLVGFLSDEVTNNKWNDAYSCVDAEITGGVKVTNGITFNSRGAGAMWPVLQQGQNQRYHFMNHEFTLAATFIIHECKYPSPMSLLSVVLDTHYEKLMEIECTNAGKLSVVHDEKEKKQLSFSTDKPFRLSMAFQGGMVKIYLDGKLIASKTHHFVSGLLTTPISHICILQCGKSNLKDHAQVTVQNVLLYNRKLSKEEIDELYLPIIPTKTPTVSKTISYTNSLSKTLSTTKTNSRSLSHTISQSLTHTHDLMDGESGKGTKKDTSSTKEKDASNRTKPKDENKHSDGQPKSSQSTRKTLKSPNVICPSIIVETFPAGVLTQKDIDGSNTGKKILLVSLPKKFYWANNIDVGSFITFSGGSGADQPNGFSGKWGEMLQHVTWRRKTKNPRSVLEVEIPTHSNYNIESHEEIVISADPKAVNGDCQGTLKGSFTIRAENSSKIVKTSTVVNSVIDGMTTVSIFCAGGVGSILEVQALSLLSRMNCASKEERDGLNLLPYFTSMFVHFGSLWMVLGNLLIVVIFGSLHYGITVFYKNMRGDESSKACARIFFPSFTYFVAYIMHIGILVHSVSLLFMLKSGWHHQVVGIAGTSYGLIFPFVVLYYVTQDIRVQFVPYPHFINQSCLKRCMSPHGYWAPRSQVKMYGSIFFTLKDKYLYWCVFHLSVICIAGIVTVIPTTTENCHIQYFCLMGIFLFGSIVTAVKNMMRSLFLTSMHTLSLFLLATLCFISGLNYVLPYKLSFNAYFLFTVMLLIVVFITLFYKICLLFYDWMNETNDAIDNIAMKEPFNHGKCEKVDTKFDTLPYGKEDPCVLMQNANVNQIRNEPYGN